MPKPFLRGGQPDGTVHPAIAVDRTDKFWMYKDTGKLIELTTDELAGITAEKIYEVISADYEEVLETWVEAISSNVRK